MVITISKPSKDGTSNNIIELPQLEFSHRKTRGYYYDIEKVVLSADPSLNRDGYIVVAINSVYCRLAFYKSWETTSTYVDQDLTLVKNFIFHKSLAYIIGSYSNFVSFDLNNESSTTSPKLKTLKPEDRLYPSNGIYLVESSKGNLFSIHKHLGVEEGHVGAHFTKEFKVFKLVLDDQTGKLLEKKQVKSLDGDVVFVGDNKTLAISALDFPQAQPNSIYYTDDYFNVSP